MNPLAWGLQAVSINELTSPTYDFQTCTNPTCTETERFGDFILKQYGNSTEELYIWYSFAVLVAEYIFLLVLTSLVLEYVRSEPKPLPPQRDYVDHNKPEPMQLQVALDEEAGKADELPSTRSVEEVSRAQPPAEDHIPFDRISVAFKDIWYSITLPSGDDIDLLKGVNGFFEPGTVTALMGSSGAGKTTLLDALAGRKTTGVIKGEIYLNGLPKVDRYFRKIMGYVEQFDNLHTKSTPREVITFSAALRLPANVLM
ncbi:ATP-binding cassette domain-containing protein [archaeon]|nr:MAG: ATP-binding cassette domain-containing protein [archaeon]